MDNLSICLAQNASDATKCWETYHSNSQPPVCPTHQDQYCDGADDPYAVCWETHHTRVKVFYINGIFNSDTYAQETADRIRGIIGFSDVPCDVVPHYNGSCPNFLCVLDPTLQQRKQILADRLVCRIHCSLTSGYEKVVLLAHSQGADIVKKALRKFTKDHRAITRNGKFIISVVAWGPKSIVEVGENIVNTVDLFSKLGQLLGKQSQGKITYISPVGPCTTLFCHGNEDYLIYEEVRQAIRKSICLIGEAVNQAEISDDQLAWTKFPSIEATNVTVCFQEPNVSSDPLAWTRNPNILN